MPNDISKIRRKSTTGLASPMTKEIYNPFNSLSQTSSQERQTKKSPKISKKVGKCFQLMLICQKLLRPFNSSAKVVQPDAVKQVNNYKEKSKSYQEINQQNRLEIHKTAFQADKVDACVQTNVESLPDISQIVLEDDYGTNEGTDDFPFDIEGSTKEPYWDLDIDSAIVGDFNSMSAFSLNEQNDPHYATIRMSADGKVIDKPQCGLDMTFYASIYPDEKISCSNSNTSSPKSGIYSKINKPRKNDEFNTRMCDYYRSCSGTRLSFEKIMAIRSQMGVSRTLGNDYPGFDDGIYSPDTPDIPKRNYGSSVINYIAKLRQNDSSQHSSKNITFDLSHSVVYLEKKLSSASIYSPIWPSKIIPYNGITEVCETPTSEPIAPKWSMNKIIHHLNPIYRDDSSDDASVISVNSPSRIKYAYPRKFYDSNSKKLPLHIDKRNYANFLNEEINRFRYMDSEADLDSSFLGKEQKITMPYRGELSKDITEINVPLELNVAEKTVLCEDQMFLQPLMERSCEEEYFKRDFLSSLDYINV